MHGRDDPELGHWRNTAARETHASHGAHVLLDGRTTAGLHGACHRGTRADVLHAGIDTGGFCAWHQGTSALRQGPSTEARLMAVVMWLLEFSAGCALFLIGYWYGRRLEAWDMALQAHHPCSRFD